jgi:hypothetical protein
VIEGGRLVHESARADTDVSRIKPLPVRLTAATDVGSLASQLLQKSAPANLPAKNAQAPRSSWRCASSLTTFAGKPAPTETQGCEPTCRSRLAGEKRPGAGFILATRVIVNDLRWQASSYRKAHLRTHL